MFPLIGLVIGVLVGIAVPFDIPDGYSIYVAALLVAIIDGVVGGYVSTLQGRFELKFFVSGVLGNGILALIFTFLGEYLNLPLYLVPLFALGNRIFQNFAVIRRLEMAKFERKNADKKARKMLRSK